MMLVLNNQDNVPVNITLDLSPDKQVSHYGLNRATNIYPTTSQKLRSGRKLVTKFYWDEVSCMNEAVIVNKVNDIAI